LSLSLSGATGTQADVNGDVNPGLGIGASTEQLYESASIIYGPVGYVGGGGKPNWFQNNGINGGGTGTFSQ
jgi:hypothetical protein